MGWGRAQRDDEPRTTIHLSLEGRGRVRERVAKKREWR